MALTAAAVAAVAALLLLSPAVSATNDITKLLSSHSDFSTFSSLLSQSGVAQQINSRSTITVLAVDNGAAGALSGQPSNVISSILSVHVILDYYDSKKLHAISNKSAILTTLYQSSGVAGNRTGFLNVTDLSDGSVAFGSAAAGSNLTANFVKEVVTQPYNISVIQVSGIIYPPGISSNTPSPTASPPAGAKSSSPSPSKAKAPSPAKAEAPAKAVNAPSPDASTPPPAADSPAADTPQPADSPAADTPPPSADSPAAAADATKTPAADKDKSSAGRAAARASLLVAVGAAFLAAL